jgi:hypothetical protein
LGEQVFAGVLAGLLGSGHRGLLRARWGGDQEK